MGQNRGGGGGGKGKKKICLRAAIVRLANAIHWIDRGSDCCGFKCSIASC